VEVFESVEVLGNVLTDWITSVEYHKAGKVKSTSGVRASSGLDGTDSLGGKSLVSDQKLLVLSVLSSILLTKDFRVGGATW
jgi:hypothetical protein